MHARFNQSAVAETSRGIRGTFYPSEGSPGARSIGPAVAKIVAVLVAMAVGSEHRGPRRATRR